MYTPSASHKVGSDGLNLSTAGLLSSSRQAVVYRPVLLRPSNRTPLLTEETQKRPRALQLLHPAPRTRPRTSLVQQPDPDSNRGAKTGKGAHERAPQEAPSTFFNQPPASSVHFPSNPRNLTLKPLTSERVHTFVVNSPHWSLFASLFGLTPAPETL